MLLIKVFVLINIILEIEYQVNLFFIYISNSICIETK